MGQLDFRYENLEIPSLRNRLCTIIIGSCKRIHLTVKHYREDTFPLSQHNLSDFSVVMFLVYFCV